MRVISFGDRKEQILAARERIMQRQQDGLDLMARRAIAIEEIMAWAPDAAALFDLAAYDAKAKLSVDYVKDVLDRVPGGDALFDDVEVSALQRAFLLAMESAQLVDVVRHQRWREV